MLVFVKITWMALEQLHSWYDCHSLHYWFANITEFYIKIFIDHIYNFMPNFVLPKGAFFLDRFNLDIYPIMTSGLLSNPANRLPSSHVYVPILLTIFHRNSHSREITPSAYPSCSKSITSKFGNDTTTVLSCYVQSFVVMRWTEIELPQNIYIMKL